MFFSAHVAISDLTKCWEKNEGKKIIFFRSIVPEGIPTQSQPNALEGNQILSHIESSLSKSCMRRAFHFAVHDWFGYSEFHRPLPA